MAQRQSQTKETPAAPRSPQAQKGVDKRGKHLQGLRVGKITELTMFYKVKPGHEEAMRKAIHNFHTNPLRDPVYAEDANVKQGLFELRHVLFDNDSRLMWMTSFDTEWDPYIDDTIVLAGEPAAEVFFGRKAQTPEEVLAAGLAVYGTMLQHAVEAPEGVANGKIPNPGNTMKDLFNSARVDAAGYLRAQPDVTLFDHRKNREIRRAFDAVLQHPDAKNALQHPALKPLRDLADTTQERIAA